MRRFLVRNRSNPPGSGKRNTVEAYEKLKQLIVSAEEDIRKAEGGNKAAGTRARQIMQDIKNAAQDVRQAILVARGPEQKP
jgi:hypothetical protein